VLEALDLVGCSYQWTCSYAPRALQIDFVTVGGRTSAVVVGVQKLYKRNGAKAIAGKSPAKSKNIVPKAESLVPLSQPPSVAGKGISSTL
jgi:hypothetical protein